GLFVSRTFRATSRREEGHRGRSEAQTFRITHPLAPVDVAGPRAPNAPVPPVPGAEAAPPGLPQLRILRDPSGYRHGSEGRAQAVTGEGRVTIAVDAMGGDHAPQEVVRGALEASRDPGVEVILVGDTRAVEPLVEGVTGASFRIVHASETVAMGDHPVESLRRRADSSVAVAAQLVKDGEADGMVSAGSTGAAMAAALLRLGRIPGVER